MKFGITRIAGLSLALLTAGTVAEGQPREFPFVAPYYCPNSIVQRPAGASPFYRSETCQTIFVLPPQMGSLEYTINTASASDRDCNKLNQLDTDREDLYKQLRTLEKAASQIGISPERLAVLERQITLIQNALDKTETSQSKLAGTQGAIMDVKLASNFSEEVNRFQFINQLLFANGTRFENAQIAESYISFDAGPKEGTDTRPAVIRTSVPGVEVRGVKNAPGSDSRIMNGSVSGTVYLGLNAICNIRDQQRAPSIARTNFEAANMEAFMPANLTYSVPLLSSFSYEASMKVDYMVKDVIEQIESRPDQFTVNSTKDRWLTTTGEKVFDWKFQAFELQDRGFNPTDLRELEARERDAVLAGWARELAETLVSMGVLRRETPTPIPAPPAGTVAEQRWREVCESKSFLGVRYSHECWNEPYSVVRVQGGLSTNVINEINRLRLNFAQKVSYRAPIYRTHTSTFKYVKKN